MIDVEGLNRGKGGAKTSYRPARWMKVANLVLCMRYLSQVETWVSGI